MSDTAENFWNQRILEHEPWLRTVVRSRLASADEVDDVLQSVLADAFGAVERQSEIRLLGPWLYRLAVNGVLQFRRKCGRRRKLHRAYAGLSVETPSGPLDLMLNDERNELIQDILKSMSGEDVEILLLKYSHEWDYLQISNHLGIDIRRIAHRLRRARSRLRERLCKSGIKGRSRGC